MPAVVKYSDRIQGVSVLMALTASFFASACADSASDCRNTATCSADSSDAGDAGLSGASGGGNGGAAGNADCDVTKGPTEESCLVSTEFAVFVSPEGDDDNDGSQREPLATLTKAVEVAAGERLVLVCDATYDENVSITAGARIYGGFKCSDWSAEADKPLFKPTTVGPALKIDGVVDEVLVEHVSFEVGDATAAGGTALTALVSDSTKVTLRAVSLTAGKGKGGANGSLVEFAFPDRTELDGNSAMLTVGGAPKSYTCPGGGKTSGGIGGSASPGGQAGGDGTPFLEEGKGKGGVPGSCEIGSGGSGATAPDSPAGSGAKTHGALTTLGWTAGSGGDGANGRPGQGGGGGASSKTGGGSGGGAGACGGAGASGGQGGGGSVALASLNSVMRVETSELVTADAGDGGSSVAGQPGDKREGGFAGLQTAGACPGGSGGLGGGGAAGGGGAGGISVSIIWKGLRAPTVTVDTTSMNGKAGSKGVGGVPGVNDGIAGVSQKILSVN